MPEHSAGVDAQLEALDRAGWRDDAAARARGLQLASSYRRIARERMAGIPILNPVLDVTVVGMRRYERSDLGVLLTPWFMNLVLLPLESDQVPGRAGVERVFEFPAGALSFIGAHDHELGGFWMCSLFSPVLQFADQRTAVTAAEAALKTLMTVETRGDPMAASPASHISEEVAPGESGASMSAGETYGAAPGASEGPASAPGECAVRGGRRRFFGVGRSRPTSTAHRGGGR